jgi:signal transduction histidine kinase
VVIYSYDEAKRLFGEWAAEIVEARCPSSNCPAEQLRPDSVPMRLVRLTEPPYYYLAEDDVSEDRLLGGRFSQSEGIRSGLGIQLRVRGRKVGVMFVNYRSPHRFTVDEIGTIQLFADQAAVAIRNAQQYDELRRAQGLVGTRTALAWMGMASSAWRHTIDKHALTIRELAQLLRDDWQQQPGHPREDRIQECIDTIRRLATQILEKPITPPLSSEDGLEAVSLSALVGERARQLWRNDPYRGARLAVQLTLPEEVTVLASPEWLRRAFDMLVDNAVNAVAGRSLREITIGTRPERGGAEIWVADTGGGIPEDIRARIGLEYIVRPEEARGLGMGLLMSHTIVQTYGGDIRVEATGPEGTTMVIWLPVTSPTGEELAYAVEDSGG